MLAATGTSSLPSVYAEDPGVPVTLASGCFNPPTEVLCLGRQNPEGCAWYLGSVGFKEAEKGTRKYQCSWERLGFPSRWECVLVSGDLLLS